MSLPTLSKYEILARIGEGGTGSVFRARHRASGAWVAIKIIPATVESNSVMLKRLEQEFLAVSRLGHPGIVRGLDFGQDGASHYLVMELVDGISLGERVERRGRLPESVAVGIVAEVTQALHAAHEQGLIHRDIKPNNIMLTRDGPSKLTDFGIVKELGSDLVLTQVNDLLGTPNFMAPELFEGAQNASVRSDIYSLAATLFTAVTGRVPFPGKSCMTILNRKISHPLPSVRQAVPTLSARTERAILRGLSPDPKSRPASCLEFLAELDATSGKAPSDPMFAPDEASLTPPPVQPMVERRGQPRRRARGSARYKPGASPYGPAAKAILVNASENGIYLVVQECFNVGESIEVELLSPQGVPILKREALVRWADSAPEGLYQRVGCSWKEPLTHAELQSFV